jgi:hypothetical protein
MGTLDSPRSSGTPKATPTSNPLAAVPRQNSIRRQFLGSKLVEGRVPVPLWSRRCSPEDSKGREKRQMTAVARNKACTSPKLRRRTFSMPSSAIAWGLLASAANPLLQLRYAPNAETSLRSVHRLCVVSPQSRDREPGSSPTTLCSEDAQPSTTPPDSGQALLGGAAKVSGQIGGVRSSSCNRKRSPKRRVVPGGR